MASAFAATYDVAVDPNHVFRKQLVGALHFVACALIDEGAKGDMLEWARRVQVDPVAEAGKWIWKMLTNATFAASPAAADDGAVVSIVRSFLPAMLKA
jgi:hypothetical protein